MDKKKMKIRKPRASLVSAMKQIAGVRLDDATHAALSKAAVERRMSISALAALIITDKLKGECIETNQGS